MSQSIQAFIIAIPALIAGIHQMLGKKKINNETTQSEVIMAAILSLGRFVPNW